MVDPRYFAPADIAGAYFRGRQLHQQQEAFAEAKQNKQRLADLLPRAVQGDRQAIDELAGLNPDLFMKLDDREREMAKTQTADLSSAVRWADTPEKWDSVIEHYGKMGVDLSQYKGRFDLREQAMMRLGKLGDYLSSAPKMDIRATEPGGGLYGIGADGSVKVLVQPNDGSHPMGASPAPPLPPGFVIDGDGGSNATGGFPG